MTVEKWMTGPMELWCDTSKPVYMGRPKITYLPPTDTALVLKLLNEVKNERSNQRPLSGPAVVRRLRMFDLRTGLLGNV